MNSTLEKILYSPLDALFHLMALMPLRVLYVLSDVLYFVLYVVVGYRRKVVRKNLAESFPDKSAHELAQIERRFYHHLADYFVETIKLLHISDDEMRRRCRFEGVELIDRTFDQGRSILIYVSHYGNWEWIPSVTLWSRHEAGKDAVFAQVYRPLKNKWFDNLFLRIRSRFHSVCFAKNTVLRDLVKARAAGKPIITGFISDQHPNRNDEGHVIRFLNHDTAMITGAEVIARKLNYVTLYFDLEKLSRGYYKCTVREISQDASQLPMGALTDDYARRLEHRIMESPAYWLWTHNRWKNKVTLNKVENR